MSDSDDQGPIPASRFREEVKLKRAAQERVAELEQQIAKVEQRAATADLLGKQLDEMRGQFTSATAAWETERAVYQLGIIDGEAIEVARHLHQRLPEANRPALPDWLRAVKDDPSKAPKALQPYLAQPSAAPAQSTAAPVPPPQVTAAATHAQRPAPTAPAAGSGAMDAAQIRALREECARTGDWSKWREAQPAIRASLRTGV